MKFCSQCGNTVTHQIPPGDSRPRYVCSHCAHVHYQNPNIVAGSVPAYEGRVLLCRRAIEPRKGYWTLPAGFMENGESLEQAARRETLEEACAHLGEAQMYTVFDLPHINQVHVFFRAEMASGRFDAGDETLEAKLFSEEDVPWAELAFRTVARTLECFFADRLANSYPVRNEVLPPLSLPPADS